MIGSTTTVTLFADELEDRDDVSRHELGPLDPLYLAHSQGEEALLALHPATLRVRVL